LPSVAAQGRSSVAVATGFEALFSNPAGFRSQPGELTLLALSPWLEGGLPWEGDLEAAMLEQAARGGVRFGGSAAIGYSGRGLGLGVFLAGGADVEGASVLAGEADFELGLIGGYSYSLRMLGLNLALGASVRPLLRAEVPLDDAAAREVIHESARGGLGLWDALWSEDAFYGVALAVDMGALADIGRLRIGLLLSDVGNTTFRYSKARFGDLVSSLATLGNIPEGRSTDESLTVPMEVRLGLAYAATSSLLLHAEMRDPASVVEGEIGWLDSLHAGLELTLEKRSKLWLGIAGTELSAGAAFRLGPLETSFALYGLDLRPERSSVTGIAAETAIRF